MQRFAAALGVLLVTACGGAGNGNAEPPAEIPRKRVEVVATYSHDPEAFTQGLLLMGDRIFESTGLRGRSSLREVDLATGEVRRRVDLPPTLFGEGLASVGSQLIQLTWTSGTARVYDRESFELVREHSYATQGWGLCNDGTRLVMSDGSSTLYFRDPNSFALEGQIEVLQSGQPRDRLNELECVGGKIYANVFETDWIVEIDPSTGAVTSAIDASGLLPAAERNRAGVLNGIAYRMGAGTFLLTGKLWPKMFEVQFVDAPS